MVIFLYLVILIFILEYESPTDGKVAVKIHFKMIVIKNNNYKCLRCNYHRCKNENKICYVCKDILKDHI
jgi:late competence protein required for DNA uptake (superfamily II DNA/RNA helicase)